MSTFDGFVKEFPAIRIDYFRPLTGKALPLACFLSHVHSDHLLGLDSLKSPFVYCSAATRRLLLRIEKYPHRMNFAKGILEARKQHYRHLRLILKPLPLHTRTQIELGAKGGINVTLFDANHCPGAVMFLIEGDGKAVLYTGDIRAEPWWVNSIVRNPILLQYTCGVKKLDCIYLDTTFASHDDTYQRFPTKAEGLMELVRQIRTYPSTTRFYFRAWTLGYEDVWIALATALGCQVHVDEYQLQFYRSLVDETSQNVSTSDGPALVGFQFGNCFQAGCLTPDWQSRVHSCEPGTDCHAMLSKEDDLVWITPIISRLNDGTEIPEIGVGGGGGDLYQAPEIDPLDETGAAALATLCQNLIPDIKTRNAARDAFTALTVRNRPQLLIDSLGLATDTEIGLETLIQAMTTQTPMGSIPQIKRCVDQRPNTIHFPYSRHASYGELCDLVSRFGPRDICPCTVDLEAWSEELSIESLFGELCSERQFLYDKQNRQLAYERQQQLNLSKKRKKNSEQSCSPERSEAYETANTSFDTVKPGKEQNRDKVGSVTPAKQLKASTNTSSSTTLQTETPLPPLKDTADGVQSQHQLDAIKSTFRGLNGGTDFISTTLRRQASSSPVRNHRHGNEEGLEDDSQTSIGTSIFDSQGMDMILNALNHHGDTSAWQLDRNQEDDSTKYNSRMNGSEGQRPSRLTRSSSRRAAFDAARRCLRYNDSSAWDEVGNLAIDRKNHSVDEAEL